MIELLEKFKKAVGHPKLTFSYLLRKKYVWSTDLRHAKIIKIQYSSYKDYLRHQKSKLEVYKNCYLLEYDNKYRDVLRQRLECQNVVKARMNVLCLAARIGTEVKAFLDLGCFAVGLDLNPGKFSKYVLHGDFHNIQFANQSVDVIFSNSLDHVYDFDRLIAEIQRVLKPKGYLILEVVKGNAQGKSPGYHEATFWKHIDDVLDLFNQGFIVIHKEDFDYPWLGQHIVLAKR